MFSNKEIGEVEYWVVLNPDIFAHHVLKFIESYPTEHWSISLESRKGFFTLTSRPKNTE